MEVGSKLEGSYAMAMRIWIQRFKTAQATIRQLEDEADELSLLVLDIAEGRTLATTAEEKIALISKTLNKMREDAVAKEGHSHG